TKNFSPKGHALIRGVAGSGKSLILRDRATSLAKEFDRILVLSYNRLMNQWLNATIESATASTFHTWAYTFGYTYDHDQNPEQRQEAIALAKVSGFQYDAILIDEAQDFYDEWFQAVLAVLNPDTQSLFFVYDNTQSIYGQPHRRKSGWTWKNLGINVTGRSQVFDVNYRNTPEILDVAWNFIRPALENAQMPVARRERDDKGKVIKTPSIGTIIEPRKKTSRSSGIKPLLLPMNRSAMPSLIAQQVKMALDSHPDSSIGVLYHPNIPAAAILQGGITRELTALGVQHVAPQSSQERSENVVRRPCVLVDSWNAVKGLEFDAVIIVGLDAIPEFDDVDRTFEAKASLYVAMTRARDHLVMLYTRQTALVESVEQALMADSVLLEG
ncbi:MAG: AAA family ATPase, partial [Merismopedia sp. SIO2A8]|nr:AAA family ATPase [Merismopedia sp. SIO2A8]